MSRYKKLFENYLEEDEISLAKIIMPSYYLEGNAKLDITSASTFLQNELNELSNSFLNGGFSRFGYLSYPLIKDVSPSNQDKIKRLYKVVLFLDKNYDFSSSLMAFDNISNCKGFANLLSCLYSDMSKIKESAKKKFIKPVLSQFQPDFYKKTQYFDALYSLERYANNKLENYFSGFYIHGSFATRDYVEGWSDVDTTAIISKNTLSDPVKIIKLRDLLYLIRKFFYKIDPLQHHGIILINEYDLDRYCQAYFPTEIFRYSKSLFDEDKKLIFRLREYKMESIKRLFWFVNYFRSLKLNKRYFFNSYDMKNLLHSITLFPSLYLQAIGKPTYKKDSFAIVKKEFNNELFAPVDYVSNLRNKWISRNIFPFFGIASGFNPLLSSMANSRMMDVFNDISKLNHIDSKYLVEKMYLFSEDAWRKIKKNV